MPLGWFRDWQKAWGSFETFFHSFRKNDVYSKNHLGRSRLASLGGKPTLQVSCRDIASYFSFYSVIIIIMSLAKACGDYEATRRRLKSDNITVQTTTASLLLWFEYHIFSLKASSRPFSKLYFSSHQDLQIAPWGDIAHFENESKRDDPAWSEFLEGPRNFIYNHLPPQYRH